MSSDDRHEQAAADGGESGCGCGGARRMRRRLRRLPGTPVRRHRRGRARSSSAGCCSPRTTCRRSIDYVVAKRRLTNRSVFGTGVVCGLDVDLRPVRRRRRRGRRPGYALDCCGNDIVVDCPETVDVLALVRELRERTGVDCGEPCEDQPRQDVRPQRPLRRGADRTCRAVRPRRLRDRRLRVLPGPRGIPLRAQLRRGPDRAQLDRRAPRVPRREPTGSRWARR